MATSSFRRLTAWEDGPGGVGETSFSSSAAAFHGQAVSPTAGPLTIVRIRGELMVMLSSATAIADGYDGAVGIGLATLPAVTAGIASVPTPLTEANSDSWLYHRFISLRAPVANEFQSLAIAARIEVDSKAMRKFDTEHAIYFAAEFTEVGIAVLRLHFNSRMLVKLP